MVSVMEAQEATVKAPTFPKWYIEAPLDEAPSEEMRILMDELRTALLDYPHPKVIRGLIWGCIHIWLYDDSHKDAIVSFLDSKGFLLGHNARYSVSVAEYFQSPDWNCFPQIYICGRQP